MTETNIVRVVDLETLETKGKVSPNQGQGESIISCDVKTCFVVNLKILGRMSGKEMGL